MSALKTTNLRLRPGKSTFRSRIKRARVSAPKSYGPPELCAWQIAPGVFWIQTTEPRFSRKLEKRQDARRVAINGVNHYRRTYEILGRRRKIQRLIDRFLMSAGGQFSGNLCPQGTSKDGESINVPASTNDKDNAFFMAGSGQSTREGIAQNSSDGHKSINTAEGIAS